MSFKNKLQEFLQKQGLPPPVYQTIPDDDHWESSLLINGHFFTSINSFLRKIDAEQQVAKCAFEYFTSTEKNNENDKKEIYEFFPPSLPTIIQKFKNVFLIDLENERNAGKFIRGNKFPENSVVIGVVSHCDPSVSVKYDFYKCVIRSSVKDATDHAISFIAGLLCHFLSLDQRVFFFSKYH